MLKSLQDPDLVNLLEAWEAYRKMTAEGQQQIRTTMDEAQHLERRAGLLASVLDRIEDADCKAHVDSVRNRLTKLIARSNQAISNGSSNSGGCFEWMDSLLVKALRQGHWLLVDNVNLCSSSVLDRLNGLLEPGGVLSLSERGVIDGQIPVVAPHPQFRLFLALDPRNGEISRAMRNRGVELFIPDDAEHSESDLISVLSSSGLTSTLLQDTLLAFHQWLCQYLPAGERPTLTELVQASSLAAQRLEMFSTSANPLSCLDETCVEVYIRPIRSPADKEAARLQLAHLLQEAFAREPSQLAHSTTARDFALTAGQVQLCPTLARVRQSAKLVRSMVSAEDVQTAVLVLYLTASEQDLEWRHDYLLKTLELDTGHISGALKSQLTGSNPSLPWDPRWFDCLSRAHFNCDPNEDSALALVDNRISLALFWTSWTKNSSSQDVDAEPIGRTLGAVIRAINQGSLAEEAAPDKLLVSLPRFLDQWDRVLDQLLSSKQVGLTNSDWTELMDAVQMRQHMIDVYSLRMEDGDELEASLSCLAQYWSWLLKRSASRVSKLLERFPVTGLDLPVNDAGQAEVVISRRLRRCLERAEPFVDESQSIAARLVASILSSASLQSVAESRQCGDLLRDFVRLLSSGDADVAERLERLDKEFQRLAASARQEVALPGTSLQVLSLLDHLLMIQHYSGHQTIATSLTALVPTVSSVLAQCSSSPARCWTEWLLSHWEIVTRLAWSRQNELQVTSPLLSLTATTLLDRNGLVTLGESTAKRERLQMLEKIFWNNADQLQRIDFDPLLNDHRLAINSLHRLIRGVCNALRIPDIQPGIWSGVGISNDAAEATNLALRLSNDPANIGSVWLLQGLARCLLLAPGDNVDPVEKRKLKAVLRRREADNVDRFLRVYRMHHEILVGGRMVMETQHPQVRHFAGLKQRLDSELAQERTLKPTWRPQSSLFQQLAKDIRHYINSVASPQSVMALHSRLYDFQGGRIESKLLLAQAELWLSAQRNFYQSLKSKYVDYPDLIVPLAAGIGQMIHGAEILVRHVRSVAWRTDFNHNKTDLDDFVADLFDRPSRLAAHHPAGVVALVQLCTSSAVGDLFDAVYEEPAERNSNKKVLLFSALKDMERYASHARRLDAAAWNSQLAILDALVASWTASEERKKQREIDQESLYRSRTIHHAGELSDAEADKRALEQYFPSYEDQFTDDEPVAMEMETEQEPINAVVDFELTPDDMVSLRAILGY